MFRCFETIGSSSKLVSIARQAKLTKIIVIADDIECDGIEVKDELEVKRIKVSDFTDQYSLELIFNSCCPNISFSAGDSKTYELLSGQKSGLYRCNCFYKWSNRFRKEVLVITYMKTLTEKMNVVAVMRSNT